jgi:phenylpropionate dioxygenase-like ring-hydroxylating dioxygenase large terminal subunit
MFSQSVQHLLLQVAQGLLWVWPDASSSALAAASPPALSSQYGAEGWTLLGGEWFARDLEYGYDTMMENL